MTQFLECSIEQEQVIADHLIYKNELVMVPSERRRIINFVAKSQPGARVKSVNLDIENVRWEIEIQSSEDVSP